MSSSAICGLDLSDESLPVGGGKLTKQWQDFLLQERAKPYFSKLEGFLEEQWQSSYPVYPEKENIFSALELTPLNQIKVVILGQDPYHGPGQAHGLCFSVPISQAIPPSLRNIFKEITDDIGARTGRHGCLESWAKQGVFLLNTVLTVRGGTAQSHAGRGWEDFTDNIIRLISDELSGVIFLLWGAPARKKSHLIDKFKHHILEATHPSPLSAYRGFLGCRHFSRTNELLKKQGREPIDWTIF